MLNSLPLQLQIRQRPPPNILRLVRHPLAVPQPLATPVQPVRTREQLLALLQLMICAAAVVIVVVAVAVAEEGFAVVGEGFEFALCGVDVGFVVAETGVEAGAG